MTRSLAFATDLALRRAEGAEVDRSPGATIVRMPGNPTFRWGNFLLVPEAGDPAVRLAQHAAAFPGAGFTTVGVDDAHAVLDEGAWLSAGFDIERLAVLTAISVTHDLLLLRKQHDGQEQRLTDGLAALRSKLDAALETDVAKR